MSQQQGRGGQFPRQKREQPPIDPRSARGKGLSWRARQPATYGRFFKGRTSPGISRRGQS